MASDCGSRADARGDALANMRGGGEYHPGVDRMSNASCAVARHVRHSETQDSAVASTWIAKAARDDGSDGQNAKKNAGEGGYPFRVRSEGLA